ncbi:hypothetical protein [Actinoplanes sp. NPDC020271]|uniref:DUF7919 family protein n=1 Tax=Actinoplanes sp. NPDC020271 TaxID=3363896 RepID=UPI0037B745A1
MEFLDLTAYAYSESALPMKAVGWLGSEYGVQGGDATPLTGAELQLLKSASLRVRSLMLGVHECEFCWAVEGNGEFRYYLPSGVIHAAPTMIVHYAEEHGYRPPFELLSGLPEAMRPPWDWRAERLCAVLRDESADFVWRADAAVDLALWDDRRAYDALRSVLNDEELVDLAGSEVGRSLAAFSGRAYASDLADGYLHPVVRSGIEKASQIDYRLCVRPVPPLRR